jgi:hypothetical protein
MSTTPTTSAEWQRELREVSAATYRITLKDPAGCIRYCATGSELGVLLEEAREWLAANGPVFGTLTARART